MRPKHFQDQETYKTVPGKVSVELVHNEHDIFYEYLIMTFTKNALLVFIITL